MAFLEVKNLEIGYYSSLLPEMNFSIPSGEKIAITGFNGIGKSTLISCILEFLKFKGVIVSNVEKVLYQPEKVILPDYIKLKDYLLLIGKIHKSNCIDKMNELIKLFGLEKVINKDLIKLSKGMRQKVILIQTIL